MTEPTPRQVLYALVAAGFVAVVIVLTVGAAVAGLVPVGWSWVMAAAIAAVSVWMARNWKRTVLALVLAIGLFLMWMVGTLILS
jgi:hypothetical protein